MSIRSACRVRPEAMDERFDVQVGDVLTLECRANRATPELEALVGYFLNPVALRTQLSGGATFRQLVQRVRGTLVGAQANSEARACPARGGALSWLT